MSTTFEIEPIASGSSIESKLWRANPNLCNEPVQNVFRTLLCLRLIRWVVVRFRETRDVLGAADFVSDSSITNATANWRSWEMDTRTWRTPIRLASSETFPRKANLGAPLDKL